MTGSTVGAGDVLDDARCRGLGGSPTASDSNLDRRFFTAVSGDDSIEDIVDHRR